MTKYKKDARMFSYVVIEMEENAKDRSVSVYKTGFKGKQFPPHQQTRRDSSPLHVVESSINTGALFLSVIRIKLHVSSISIFKRVID